MTLPEPLRVEVAARAESVPVVRHAIVGIADAGGLEPLQIKDIEIAVTEACTNAVLHAYDDEQGTIDVTAWAGELQLVVAIRDRGRGMSAASKATPGLGLGIPLMEGLADQATFRDHPGGGTEVRLTFLHDRPAKGPA